MERFSIIEEKIKVKRIVEQDKLSIDINPTDIEMSETEDGKVSDVEGNDVTESNPVKFFSKLFESKEMAHMLHLQANGESSYATHMALETFYTDIIDDIDNIVEVYQGQYDIIEGYDVINKDMNDSEEPVQYFIETAEFIKRTRNSAILEEDIHIQSIVDDILIKMYKLIYKLRFLK